MAELEARLESLKAVLPEQKDVADLLRRIETLATQSNLAIQGFKPAPSVTKQLHAEWPIALQLDGTYHNLAMFFDRVSKFSRIINVSNIAIRAKEKPAAQFDDFRRLHRDDIRAARVRESPRRRARRRTDVETTALKTGVMAAVFVAATGLVCAQGAPAVQPATPASPQPAAPRGHGTGAGGRGVHVRPRGPARSIRESVVAWHRTGDWKKTDRA